MNCFNKGIERAASVPLTEEVHVLPSSEPRALDWYALEQSADGSPFRWSGPSLRPRLLIPFTGDIAAHITLHLLDYDPEGIDSIRLTLNGDAIEHRTRRDPPDRVDLEIIGRLRPEQPSVLELILPGSLCPGEIDGAPDRRGSAWPTRIHSLAGEKLGEFSSGSLATGSNQPQASQCLLCLRSLPK